MPMPTLLRASRTRKWQSTGGYGRLAYGALAAIASARRRETERTPDSARATRLSANLTGRFIPLPMRAATKLVRRPELISTNGRRSRSKTVSRFPRSCAEQTSRPEGAVQRRHGKFPGRDGKTSFGASMRASMITGCSPSRLESSSIRCRRSFLQSRRSSRSTD